MTVKNVEKELKAHGAQIAGNFTVVGDGEATPDLIFEIASLDIPGDITHVRIIEGEKASVHFGKEIDENKLTTFNPNDINGDVIDITVSPDSKYALTCEVYIEVENIELNVF